MSLLIQFALGLVFGTGLVVAGMSDPAKVLNFLDLAAIGTNWDPSLAFVLAAAIGVTFIGFRLVLRRPRPLIGDRFHLPQTSAIDAPIIAGPAIFGIGWGLVGLCPGPAFVSLGMGRPEALIFVPAMMAGMWGATIMARRAIRAKQRA